MAAAAILEKFQMIISPQRLTIDFATLEFPTKPFNVFHHTVNVFSHYPGYILMRSDAQNVLW